MSFSGVQAQDPADTSKADTSEAATSEAATVPDKTAEVSDVVAELPPPPTAPSETRAPRKPSTPRPRVAAPPRTPSTSSSNAYSSGWGILDEPAKSSSTPASPLDAFGSPFSGEPLSVIAQQMKLALPLPDAQVVILKSQRRLDLYSGSTLVKSYHVALGSSPLGHKGKQGDGRTPEGRYYICTRNSTTSAFHVFLGLSYPALPDARRAVNEKQISWREYQIINQRLAARSAPLWETKLGGWIGIHGGTGDSFARKKMQERGNRDWTAGCIALTNIQIEEIHAATQLGTPVDIRP